MSLCSNEESAIANACSAERGAWKSSANFRRPHHTPPPHRAAPSAPRHRKKGASATVRAARRGAREFGATPSTLRAPLFPMMAHRPAPMARRQRSGQRPTPPTTSPSFFSLFRSLSSSFSFAQTLVCLGTRARTSAGPAPLFPDDTPSRSDDDARAHLGGARAPFPR